MTCNTSFTTNDVSPVNQSQNPKPLNLRKIYQQFVDRNSMNFTQNTEVSLDSPNALKMESYQQPNTKKTSYLRLFQSSKELNAGANPNLIGTERIVRIKEKFLQKMHEGYLNTKRE